MFTMNRRKCSRAARPGLRKCDARSHHVFVIPISSANASQIRRIHMRPDDVCPRPTETPIAGDATRPLATPITLSTVWQCGDPAQADALLGADGGAYVYSRDRHPNADALAEKCRILHAADRATVTASGMAAMSLALVSQ